MDGILALAGQSRYLCGAPNGKGIPRESLEGQGTAFPWVYVLYNLGVLHIIKIIYYFGLSVGDPSDGTPGYFGNTSRALQLGSWT